MKKSILLSATALLLLVSGILIYINFKQQIRVSDLIVKVDNNDFLNFSQEDVLNLFEKNKAGFKALSDYLLANETVLRTNTFTIKKEDRVLIDRILDDSIKNIANNLLNEGIVEQVSSRIETSKEVTFIVHSEYGVYEQGIRYASDIQNIEMDKDALSYDIKYMDLGDGWFYYLYHAYAIKNADSYKKIAWELMTEDDKKVVNNDWQSAIVSLADWNLAGTKYDNRKREFVVSVCYNTASYGLTGPFIVYIDPSTKKVVGRELWE